MIFISNFFVVVLIFFQGRKPKEARLSDLTGDIRPEGEMKNDYTYSKLLLSEKDKKFYLKQIPRDVAVREFFFFSSQVHQKNQSFRSFGVFSSN